MKSHTYQCGNNAWKIAAIPVAIVLIFAAAMQGMERTHRVSPWPLLDLDRTIVTHQVSLAARAPPARTVFLGDSSCLMNMDATRAPGMINLGTISHLGLEHHARLLARYLQHAAEPPDIVVVLLHPDALRRERDEANADTLFDTIMSGQTSPPKQTMTDWLGVELFRDYFLARVLPIPLIGAYGRHYGYTRNAFKVMEQNNGSLIAAGRYDPASDTGNNEIRLAGKAITNSILFRTSWPEGIRLAIGLAPVPDSFAADDHAALAVALLHEWNQYMKAEVVLDQLPFVLPDDLFADRRHLNKTGRTNYTESMLRAIDSRDVNIRK